MSVPCKNCLTLAMCKARIDKGDLVNLLCLTDMCQPFQYFIYPAKDPQNKTQITKTDIEHLDSCVELLRNSLLKGIKWDDEVRGVSSGY